LITEYGQKKSSRCRWTRIEEAVGRRVELDPGEDVLDQGDL